MKYFIGIDPGTSGALSFFNDDMSDCGSVAYDEEAYRATLEELAFHECTCCLEQVHSFSGQGVSSTFTFGMNFGIIKGMLKAFRIPYQEIPPQRWKKEFGLNSDKQKSVEVAHHLFPTWELKRSERCKKEHDGIAESLLMAEYARRKLKGDK